MQLRTKKLIMASFFAVLTIVGGWIKVPMFPVPVTLQTFFVLLAGLIAGPVVGMASQCVYLALGLIGLPVFTLGGGPGYIFQPTFGYLLGFPLAAYVTGRISHRSDDTSIFFRLIWANLSGLLIISVCGISYLYLNLNYIAGNPLPFTKVLLSGFLIILPSDLIKVLLAAYIGKMLWKHPLFRKTDELEGIGPRLTDDKIM